MQLSLYVATRPRAGWNCHYPVPLVLRHRTGIAYEKPVHPPEESLNALNPRVLPVQITIRRRGKQAVETGRIGAVAGHHLVGRHNVAETLRHLRAVFDHHPLSEQTLHGFGIFYQTHIAHELGPEA